MTACERHEKGSVHTSMLDLDDKRHRQRRQRNGYPATKSSYDLKAVDTSRDRRSSRQCGQQREAENLQDSGNK